jgi:hypothetical protein
MFSSRLLPMAGDHRVYPVPWCFAAYASGFLLLITWLYWPLVPPGSDGDANSTYQTMTNLLQNFQYHISRTPGQPALDLINAVTFGLGGKAALIGTYLLICLLGVSAFYRTCSAHRVQYPFLSATTLLLCPHFVAHVTGLGDFALSLSLFLICLNLSERRRYRLAALAYVASIGCRLSYCLFVFPLVYYIYSIEKDEGDSVSYYAPALRFAVRSAIGSFCLFSPLFLMYGPSLFRNLGWQSFSYHATSSLYKLVSRGLGLPLSLLLLSLIVISRFKTSQRSASVTDRWFDAFLVMTMFTAFVVFFLVPTKSEILLPLLAALFMYVGRHYRLLVSVCTLTSIIFLGFIHVDLRDPADDSLALRLANGLYVEAYQGAYENRKGGQAIKEATAHLPARSVLVTNFKRCYPIDEGNFPLLSDGVGNDQPTGPIEQTIRLPGSRLQFPGMESRYVVSFQDDDLKEFLETNALAPETDRYRIFYDPRYAHLARRWQRIDPSRFGSPLKIYSPEIGFFPPEGLTVFRFGYFPAWLKGLPRGTEKTQQVLTRY